MTHDDAFLRAILENPDEDTPRLIYADGLEERDDPRGEFIRIQCQLAAMSADDERRSLLECHERDLLARHQGRWLGELRPFVSGWTFRRGFLDAIAVPATIYLQRRIFPHPATVRRIEVDLEGFEPPRHILELVPESVARENGVLPIGARGRTLVMAAGTRPNPQLLEFILNRRMELVVANGEQVMEAIDRHYHSNEIESVTTCFIDIDPPIDFEMEAEDDDSPYSKLVTLIILEAQSLHANRIRIQPQPDRIQVFYRIDRKWVERDSPPRRLLNPVVARIRFLTGLAPDQEGETQTGHLRGNSSGISFDLAVHIQPTEHGPSVSLMFWPTNEPEA